MGVRRGGKTGIFLSGIWH